MSQRATPPFRADHVGSLLRPLELARVRRGWQARDVPEDAFRAVETAAIREVVSGQLATAGGRGRLLDPG